MLKLIACILGLTSGSIVGTGFNLYGRNSINSPKDHFTQSQREQIQLACIREFGAPIDSTLNLFDINQDFVLQVTYERDRLLKFEVKPKYFLNNTHPEWTEPNDFPLLSQELFRSLVNRLETIEAKGKLKISINKIAFVTNQTGYYREGYKKAALRWGQVGPRGDPPSGVRFFSVEYGRLSKIKKERTMKKKDVERFNKLMIPVRKD